MELGRGLHRLLQRLCAKQRCQARRIGIITRGSRGSTTSMADSANTAAFGRANSRGEDQCGPAGVARAGAKLRDAAGLRTGECERIGCP